MIWVDGPESLRWAQSTKACKLIRDGYKILCVYGGNTSV